MIEDWQMLTIEIWRLNVKKLDIDNRELTFKIKIAYIMRAYIQNNRQKRYYAN